VVEFPRITSRQHEVVKRFRHAAQRESGDVVVLDGEHLLSEALRASVPIEVVLAALGHETHRTLAARAHTAGAAVYDAGPSVIEAASPVRTPSGLVALARWQPSPLEAVLRGADALVVALCGVQDPGNVGSVIRSADALGATGVLALDATAHPAGWRALRGAMGSTFRIPVAVSTVSETLTASGSGDWQILATVAQTGRPADAVDLRRPSLLLLGSEGSGLDQDIVERATTRVSIPMRAGVNSLNVAATAALLLYEARRQRTS
jgi:RNA methyltransferase, TrmH family